MPQITKTILPVLCFTVLVLIAGCGDPNSKSTFNADNGAHVTGWAPSGHVTQARQDAQACAECHGADFSGGMSGVACTQCHLGNETAIHPLDWSGDLLTVQSKHPTYVAANGDSACRNTACHGANAEGVNGSGPSCKACHQYP